MSRNPIALFCFSPQDDQLGGGKISRIADCLVDEIRSKGVFDFSICRSGHDHDSWRSWGERMSQGIGRDTFLFPVFTASFFSNKHCLKEFEEFFMLARDVSIVSSVRCIYYNDCDALEFPMQREDNGLAMYLRESGLVYDWRHLRHTGITDERFGQALDEFARGVKRALDGDLYGMPEHSPPNFDKSIFKAGSQAYGRHVRHQADHQPFRPVESPETASFTSLDDEGGAPTQAVSLSAHDVALSLSQQHRLQQEEEIVRRSGDRILRRQPHWPDSPAKNLKKDTSLPAPRNLVGTVIVSKDGQGHFETLGMALSHVSDGATILLRKGFYREVLRISAPLRNVTMRGEGALGDAVLQCESESVLNVSGGNEARLRPIIYLENVVIEGGARSRHSAPALILKNGACVMRRCIVRGGRYCVQAMTGALLEINDCGLYGAYAACVHAGDGSTVKVVDSKIAQAMRYGVEVRRGSKVLVEDSKLFDCASSGVCVAFGASGSFVRNNVYANKGSGFVIFGSSNPHLEGNEIYQNDNFGIEIQFNSGGVYRNNRMIKNERGSRNMRTLPRSHFTWSGNKG